MSFDLLLATGPVAAFKKQFHEYPAFLADGARQMLINRENRIILTGVGASILLFHQYDRTVQEYSREHALLPERFSQVLDQYGGGIAYPLSLVGVGVVSCVRKDSWEEGFRNTKYLFTAIGVTGVLTELVKSATGRERPNGKGRKSFPSGHTSGSFAVAATLDELYGRSVGIPSYIIAGLVGLQRIHDNKHWLTDVLAGAALGTVVGKGFGTAHEREERRFPASAVLMGKQGYFQIRLVIGLN